MDPALQAGLLALSSIALFLDAAKFHGRAVRLLREYHGHTQVAFGGTNPPFVQALWRRDRIRFWTLAAIVAGAFALLTAAGRLDGIVPDWVPPWRPFAIGAMALVGWAFSIAFLLEGAWVLAELARDGHRGPPAAQSPAAEPAWGRSARRGTLLLLAAAAALIGVVIALAAPF